MNTGQIIKSKSTKSPYTQIHNELIRNNELTLEEKGLMAYILSLPDDWVLYRKNLYNVLPDNKGTIDRLFRSLQKKGFIVSAKQIGADGRFTGWNHIVYDKSIHRDIETPMSDKPSSVNAEFGQTAPILNTNTILNTKLIQKKKEYIKPSLTDITIYIQEKGYDTNIAQKFFDYYEAGDWHDSNGRKVKNWKQKLNSVWFKDENKVKKVNLPPNWQNMTLTQQEQWRSNNGK
jgi:hypothetical protein